MLSTKPDFKLYQFRIKSYLNHKLKAKGIIFMHSPFVYNLQQNVLYNIDKTASDIDPIRRALRKNNTTVRHDDHGINKGIRTYKLKHIAKTSSQQPRYSKLIAQLANHFNSKNIVELGTSLGFTTATIALRNPQAQIITIDASREVLEMAENNFKKLLISNITTINTDFDSAIDNPTNYPTIHQPVDMVIFDGNHQKHATLKYFNHFLQHRHNETIFIFDDIYWSKEMNQAWQQIKKHPQVTLSLDLYKIGIIFFRTEIKQKRNFMIKM